MLADSEDCFNFAGLADGFRDSFGAKTDDRVFAA